MESWKSLKNDPPKESCNICVKVGSDFETYKFQRFSEHGWQIFKGVREVKPGNIPDHALYINLDKISDEKQCE